jgi:hypothetical protein
VPTAASDASALAITAVGSCLAFLVFRFFPQAHLLLELKSPSPRGFPDLKRPDAACAHRQILLSIAKFFYTKAMASPDFSTALSQLLCSQRRKTGFPELVALREK